MRAFIAISPPPGFTAHVRQIQRRLAERVRESRSVRWTRPDQLHLTLHFLGNVTAAALPELNHALARDGGNQPAFTLHLGSPGAFPHAARPRVWWLGLAGDLEPLGRLQRSVQRATGEFGTNRETRPFHPHLTLARIKVANRGLRDAWESFLHDEPIGAPAWRVSDVHLFASELASDGARHRLLQTVNLLPA